MPFDFNIITQAFLRLTCTTQENSEDSLALDQGRQILRKKPLLKQLRNHEKGNTASCVEKLSSTQLAKKNFDFDHNEKPMVKSLVHQSVAPDIRASAIHEILGTSVP